MKKLAQYLARHQKKVSVLALLALLLCLGSIVYVVGVSETSHSDNSDNSDYSDCTEIEPMENLWEEFDPKGDWLLKVLGNKKLKFYGKQGQVDSMYVSELITQGGHIHPKDIKMVEVDNRDRNRNYLNLYPDKDEFDLGGATRSYKVVKIQIRSSLREFLRKADSLPLLQINQSTAWRLDIVKKICDCKDGMYRFLAAPPCDRPNMPLMGVVPRTAYNFLLCLNQKTQAEKVNFFKQFRKCVYEKDEEFKPKLCKCVSLYAK